MNIGKCQSKQQDVLYASVHIRVRLAKIVEKVEECRKKKIQRNIS